MRTGYGARTKVLGAALLASLGGGALGQAGGTLEGTLYAPTGQTVAGATVVACFPEGDGCDEDKSVAVTVKGGSSAPFRLAGLGAGPYAVIAFKDMNDDDDLGDGDLVGAYSKNGDEPSLVKPPARGLEVRLGVTGSSGEPATPAATPAGPATEVQPARTEATPAQAASAQATPKPAGGQLYGWAVDRQDRPLAGARIEVVGRGYFSNGMPREEKLTVRTDKNGRYALDLLADTPAGSRCPVTYSAQLGMYTDPGNCRGTAGSDFKWTAQGYVDVTYNGQAYCLPMDGTSFDPFTSAGAERGWAYPEKALAQLNPTLWVEGLSARKEYTIKLKLVPDGPLWNGSKGQPIELTLKTDRVDRGVALFGWRRDIPLGRYRLTAALVEPNGRERALSVASVLDRAGGSPWNAKYGQYGASVVVNFEQPHCSETPLRAIGLKVG